MQIIDEAKRLIPGKPIRYVVNTHRHIDHSSGLRTFVAEGATIVTHQVNKAYLEKLFAPAAHAQSGQTGSSRRSARPSSRRWREEGADRRQPRHRAASLQRERAQRGADRGVPAEGEDAASRPMPSTRRRSLQRRRRPRSARTRVNLAEHIDRLKLDVQRIIPIHYPADNRNVGPGELMKMVGRAN